MCSIFYPGEIFLEFVCKLLSRDRSAHTAKRMCPTEHCTTGEPRARAHARKSKFPGLLLVTQIMAIHPGLTMEK